MARKYSSALEMAELFISAYIKQVSSKDERDALAENLASVLRTAYAYGRQDGWRRLKNRMIARVANKAVVPTQEILDAVSVLSTEEK